MKLVDTQRDFTRGLFLSDNYVNVPPNSLGPGTYNYRLQLGGSLKSRLCMSPLHNYPVGYYTYAEQLVATGGVATGTLADFLTSGNNGGSLTPAAGAETSNWVLVIPSGTHAGTYPITIVAAHAVTATGIPDGTYASGNWYVAYTGEVRGLYRWYQQDDPTVKRYIICYGKRIDIVDDAGAVKSTYITATSSTNKTVFAQVGNDVCISNGIDLPVFAHPLPATQTIVAGVTTALGTPPFKAATIFQQRIVFFHISDASALTTWHPIRMDYSLLNDASTLQGDSKEVGDGGTKGMGRGAFSFNDSLWFLLDRSIYMASGNTMNTLRISEAFADIGCAGQATVAFVGGQVVWLDAVKPAIWAFNGGMPRDISAPIKDALNACSPTELSASFAFSYNKRYYITFGGKSETWIYDPLFDPGDAQGGGWMCDNYGIEVAAERWGTGDDGGFLAVIKQTYFASSLKYVLKMEYPATYYDTPVPGGTIGLTPTFVTSRRTTQDAGSIKKFKKVKLWATPVNDSQGIDFTVWQDTGNSTWVSVPVTTPVGASGAEITRLLFWLVKNSGDSIRMKISLFSDSGTLSSSYIIHGYDLVAETVGR